MTRKDALVKFLADAYEKQHGARPTGEDARALEKQAEKAAETSAANKQERYRGK